MNELMDEKKLKDNYYALFLAIVSKKEITAKDALMAMCCCPDSVQKEV